MHAQPVTRGRATLVAALLILPLAACGPATAPPSTAATPAAAPDSVSFGYGRQARRDVTGSISVITEEELSTMRVARVEELIQGRVPGVQVVRRPGGDFSVRIRGVSSFRGDDEPLYVIDGVPIRGRSLGSALIGIVPQDVARIEVLKDAAAAAVYGSQGGNGVIIITTKRRY